MLGLDAIAFARHVAVAVLEDIEDRAVGTIFKSRGIGEVGGLQILANLSFAVPGSAMSLSAVVTENLLAVSDGLGSGLYRIGLARGRDGDRVVARPESGLGFLR